MIRPLYSLACIALLFAGLTSCLPDEKKKNEQMVEWKAEIDAANKRISEINELMKNQMPIEEDWEEQVESLSEEKAGLDVEIQDNESLLKKLKEERDEYAQRFDEFRVIHPID